MYNYDITTIGGRLHHIIKVLQLKNGTELSEKTGLHKSYIYQVLNNELSPTADKLERFSSLNINLNYLIADKGEPLLSATAQQTPPASQTINIPQSAISKNMAININQHGINITTWSEDAEEPKEL